MRVSIASGSGGFRRPIGFPTDGKVRGLRPVLQGIWVTYLEYDGLTHGTCGLGGAAADGLRVAQEIADQLWRGRCNVNDSNSRRSPPGPSTS